MPAQPEFSVVVPGALWVGSHPSRAGPLRVILRALREAGAGAIITLTEAPLDRGAMADAGLEGLHLPVENYTAPTAGQLAEGVAFIDRVRAGGSPTLVHCFAGIGRAGTLAAAYLIHGGESVDEAVARLRRLRHPGCVETRSQRESLEAFARLPR